MNPSPSALYFAPFASSRLLTDAVTVVGRSVVRPRGVSGVHMTAKSKEQIAAGSERKADGGESRAENRELRIERWGSRVAQRGVESGSRSQTADIRL